MRKKSDFFQRKNLAVMSFLQVYRVESEMVAWRDLGDHL